MNYFIFTYTNKEGQEKELKMRLTSGDAMEIETSKKVKILEYLQEESLSMVLTLLRYMRKWEDRNFSINQASQLYDELIDSGMTFKRILAEIIYETLVVSGFLEKGEWENIKAMMKKKDEKIQDIIEENI